MIERLLIANRGEIAVRIIRAARTLEMETVAVYSEQDRYGFHTRLADHSVSLGSGPAIDNYLNIHKMIEVAKDQEVDAIHPGYGFLSESTEFAKAVINEGFKWVGPNPEAISKLGDKLQSRKVASKVGVPITPGCEEALDSNKDALRIAREIGYPVMIKAAYGGGGMGMQVVRSEDNLIRAIKNTKRQAKAAFGRSDVFIEKFVEKPRHIEIQFIADKKGHIVHMGERECSIQRRNQKLIEEAPSPVITDEMREYIGNKVKELGKSVGYVNAGTAEFLFKDGEFYFNEVNARLQVEHPVTEMVTGKDIVIEQLKIASDRRLSWKQEDIQMNGHAIELRINAEDPISNFMPSFGKIKALRIPGGMGVRFDTHIYEGYVIPSDYDSLLGKLIVWGEDRSQVIYRSYYALSEFVLTGIAINTPMHRVILANKQFHKGNLSTSFIEDNNIIPYIEEAFNRRVAGLFLAGLQTTKVVLPNEFTSSKWKQVGKYENSGMLI